MTTKNIPSPTVVGHLDAIHGIYAFGWATCPGNPQKALSVEIVCDGEVVAITHTSLHRPDVAAVGIENAYCGFVAKLPLRVFDGKMHTFTARVREYNHVLNGETSLTTVRPQISSGFEGIDGTTITGWAFSDQGRIPANVRIRIDDKILGDFAATGQLADGRSGRFHAPIPPEYLDGGLHRITGEIPDYLHDMGEMIAITPAISTPFSSLQKYAGGYLKAHLSPIAGLRYEALRKNLHALLDSGDTPGSKHDPIRTKLEQLLLSHEQVISGIERRREYEPLAFPKVAAPKVSIVIPAHNKFEVTYNCLASIAGASNSASYEVILVDDGSSDQTTGIEELVSGMTVLRNELAQGFILSSNRGASVAKGEYVVMLNNDTEVMANWLDELLAPFGQFDKVGAVGAKLIYPDGTLQEAGGLIWGNGDAWNVGRNGNASDPMYNYVRQVDYLTGACVMLPRDLWTELGGFDTHFVPAYYEDTDLSFRVRAAGYKTVYTPFCQVVHYEGQSNGSSTASGVKRHQLINEPKFRARWTSAFRHNGVMGRDEPRVVQDRQVNGRVLVFDAQTLTPDRDAGSYAAVQELRLLQSLGFKVTFVPSNMAYMAGYTEALQRMGVEVVYAPFATSMHEVLEKRGHEFDLIYIARYGVATQLVDFIRSRNIRAKTILNIHDLHFLRELRMAISAGDDQAVQQATKTRDAELAVMRKVDLVVSYSEVEHAVIQSHNLNSTKLSLNPWIVEVPSKVPAFGTRKDISFLGGFGHTPNIEAVEWFVKEVMPILRGRLPGVRFLVYGSNPPDRFARLASDDVIIKGFVKSTDEVYDTSRVFVAPLLSGAGIKGKVIGAFASGVPTVLTPTAAEGTGARHDHEALIAKKPVEWAEAIVRLYSEEQTWKKVSENAREYASQAFSFARGREMMASSLNMVGLYPSLENDALFPLSM